MESISFNVTNSSFSPGNFIRNSPSVNLMGRSVSVPLILAVVGAVIVIAVVAKFFIAPLFNKPKYVNPWAGRLRLDPNNQNFPTVRPLLEQAFAAEKKNAYTGNYDYIAGAILAKPNGPQVAEIKSYLADRLATVGSIATYFSPAPLQNPVTSGSVAINAENLDPYVFSWQVTKGVQGDIQQAGRRDEDDDTIEAFGAASQFNGAESPGRDLVRPFRASRIYRGDRTQGPQAQLQFHPAQVEAVNFVANLGYNGLRNMLSEETDHCVQNGYFTPDKKSFPQVYEQFKDRADQIEYLSIEGCPYQSGPLSADPVKPVHLFLVAAPAFGFYSEPDTVVGKERIEIEFLCALHAFRAQFQRCIDLAEEKKQPVLFKPTAIGLGAFGNRPLSVAKAFYVAALEYQYRLAQAKVKVVFQVYQGTGGARECVEWLGLQEMINLS